MEVAVFVAVLKGKGLWWFAKADAQHVVDGLHHFFLAGTQLFHAFAVFVCAS